MYDVCVSQRLTWNEWLARWHEIKNQYGAGTSWRWLFWNVTGGSGQIMFGVPMGYNRPSWATYTLLPLYRFLLWCQDMKRQFCYRVFREDMHHVVFTDLKPGYYDKDWVMLYANFKLLTDYVEKECGGEAELDKWSEDLADPAKHGQQGNHYNPPDLMTAQADRQNEILDLYRWWKYTLPAERTECNRLLHSVYGNDPVKEGIRERRDQYNALREKIEDAEQKMLHRLIDIRKCLWT